MKISKGLVYSFILHISIFLIAYFGLPSIQKKLLDESVMSVDIVQISDISNIKYKKAQKASQEEIKEKEAKKDIPKPIAKDDEKKDKIEKDIPKSKEIDKTEKIEKDKQIIEKEVKKDESVTDKPKKIEKREEKKENKTEKKQDDVDLDSLLKTLEKPAKKNDSVDKDNKKDESKEIQEEQTQAEGTYNKNMPLSFSDKDAIRNQITDVWNFQVGAKESKDLSVKLIIKIEKDGTVISVEISDNAKYLNGTTAYKAFVNSAIRAAKRASPFKGLSVDRYDSWRELGLNFNPSGLVF